MKADFSGWASKAGIRCTDGRVIQPGAFKDKDQKKIPLVWSHGHNDVSNVLGHAIVEDRAEGVYVYGFFNGSEKAKAAKEGVQHGDLDSLSVYANRLVQKGDYVEHGNLVEVSLVLAGANPEAWIENVSMAHGDGSVDILEDEVVIHSTSDMVELRHDDEAGDPDEEENEEEEEEEDGDREFVTIPEVLDSMDDRQRAVVHALLDDALSHADTTEGAAVADQTVEDVYNAFSPEQKSVVDFLVGTALDNAGSAAHADDDTNTLSHSQEGKTVSNVFDQNNQGPKKPILSHDDVKSIMDDAKKIGSLKEAVLQHADNGVLAHANADGGAVAGTYGIQEIELLFPDAKTVGDMPNIISRRPEWVQKVLNATKHVPFSKIKSIAADLTEDEARAKGYIKGRLKKDEVFSLLKRQTGPTTIYKKQRLDRDDIIDITDFDVVAFLKWEIRFMLDEEIARAILVGDGRAVDSDDKILDPIGDTNGIGIRSIANENELYAIKVDLDSNVSDEQLIDQVAFAQEDYRGSGNPVFYTTTRNLTSLLLLKDRIGRRLYGTRQELASALQVSDVVAVPVMEETPELLGIIVNLGDYSVGTNQGGQLTFFEDFDIDFNQNKYLMETRISGALTKPKSAIVIRRNQGTEVAPTVPSFNASTNTITIPTKEGVEYRIDGTPKTGDVVITKDTEVKAFAKSGFYLKPTSTKSWSYTFSA